MDPTIAKPVGICRICSSHDLLRLTDRIQVVWDRQDLHQAVLNQQQLKFHFVHHPDTNVTKFSSLYLAW